MWFQSQVPKFWSKQVRKVLVPGAVSCGKGNESPSLLPARSLGQSIMVVKNKCIVTVPNSESMMAAINW